MRVDSDEWWDHAIALTRLAAAGDTEAASELSGHVQPWVLRLAGTQFPFRGDAEDVAQNVSITVLQRSTSIRKPNRVRSWLAAVTFNEVRSFYRRKSQESDRLFKAHDGRPPPEAALERTSVLGGMRVDLLEAVEDLTPNQAKAFGLRQFGVPYSEIAEEMAEPVGSVKRWVNEARTVVRSRMS